MQESATAPNVSTERQREQFCSPDERGRLTYTVLLPVIEGHAKIDQFYKRLAAECEKYCRNGLLKLCCEEDHVNAAWEYSYRLTFKPHVENEYLEISVTSALYDKTSRKMLKSHSESHLWSLVNDMMMPKPRKRTKRCNRVIN